LPGEMFYDAAAMLTAFSLLGHWLEMRSRFATGRAVEALLNLAPPTARRVRDGREEDVPLAAVALGDSLAVRPGDPAPVQGVVTAAGWLAVGHHGVSFALSAAVAAVVIACPDALALATPTAITVGVGRAARAGVLFRNAAALEAAARVDTVVFDKTGTLTEGRPSVTDIVPAAGVGEAVMCRLASGGAERAETHVRSGLVAVAQMRRRA